ncbi:hypothetical protein CBL_06161 [Carabus blaptoides fortunei]
MEDNVSDNADDGVWCGSRSPTYPQQATVAGRQPTTMPPYLTSPLALVYNWIKLVGPPLVSEPTDLLHPGNGRELQKRTRAITTNRSLLGYSIIHLSVVNFNCILATTHRTWPYLVEGCLKFDQRIDFATFLDKTYKSHPTVAELALKAYVPELM